MPPGAPHRQSLLEPRGAFVTIHTGGELRGCIGRVDADTPLYLAVEQLAVAAATRDPRFEPLRAEELTETRVEISVLSPLRQGKRRRGRDRQARPGDHARRAPRPALAAGRRRAHASIASNFSTRPAPRPGCRRARGRSRARRSRCSPPRSSASPRTETLVLVEKTTIRKPMSCRSAHPAAASFPPPLCPSSPVPSTWAESGCRPGAAARRARSDTASSRRRTSPPPPARRRARGY